MRLRAHEVDREGVGRGPEVKGFPPIPAWERLSRSKERRDELARQALGSFRVTTPTPSRAFGVGRSDGRRACARRGCDVTLAGIEFTDPHYSRKFGPVPLPACGLRSAHGAAGPRRAVRPGRSASLTRAREKATTTWSASASPEPGSSSPPTCPLALVSEIRRGGGRCWPGSRSPPTWCVPAVTGASNLKGSSGKLATRAGGGALRRRPTKFQFAGGQVRSLLSLLSYFRQGRDA